MIMKLLPFIELHVFLFLPKIISLLSLHLCTHMLCLLNYMVGISISLALAQTTRALEVPLTNAFLIQKKTLLKSHTQYNSGSNRRRKEQRIMK